MYATDQNQILNKPLKSFDSKAKKPKSHFAKRQYVIIDEDQRREFYQYYLGSGLTIKEAAAEARVNYSTAKNIVRE
jgi:hypothetical protein